MVKVGEGNGNPLQYSCLENPMDRGAGQATVLGIAKSWKLLSELNSNSENKAKKKEKKKKKNG